MDEFGSSVSKAPILTNTNYASWKVRMESFIKVFGYKTWNSIVKGWDPPKVIGADGKFTDVLKPEKD